MNTRLSLTVLLLVAFLLGACGPSAEQIAAMTASAWTPTPKPTAIPPTNTAIPPSPTPIPPTSTPDSVIFRDDFDGSLGEGWSWLGEDPTHWSLTNTPGSLRIVAQPSNIFGEDGIRNFLVRPIPAGDFQIETLVRFEPFSNFQFAGLLIYEVQGKALQFGRAFAQCDSGFCKGNAIYFDIVNPNVSNPPNFATVVSGTSQAYLRLQRVGNEYSAYYSPDGKSWTLIGTHISDFAPTYVGLIATQGYQEEAPADFEYFEILTLP